jgi:electron transfer flavoprotein alpha subunit
MSNTVLAFVEQREGNLKKTAYEVVSAAADLAAQLNGEAVALLIGSGVEGLAPELAKFGATKVMVCDGDDFGDYLGACYAPAIVHVAQQLDPAALLFPASSMGRDAAPRVAAKLGTSVASDCVALKAEGEKPVAKRPIFAGKAFVWVENTAAPLICTLRPNVFTPSQKQGAGEVEKVEFKPDPTDKTVTLKEMIASSGDRVELTEADIICSGGRAMKGPENFHLIEKLAAAFQGAVGASRAAVDAGWRPHADQVGQTGKTVSPTLYVACGISGAIQHLAGMSSSKIIVAINKDPEAPIFKMADYGIVGDLFEVIPVLTEAVKNAKSE